MQASKGLAGRAAMLVNEDSVQWAADVAVDAYHRTVKHARAHPRSAALIATGVGLAIGWILTRVGARKALVGVVSSIALAAGGAAWDRMGSGERQ